MLCILQTREHPALLRTTTMGLDMLPDESLLVLKEQWPCREPQLRQLDALLSVSLFAMDQKTCDLRTDRNSLVSPVRLPWSHTARRPQERAASSHHIWKRAVRNT